MLICKDVTARLGPFLRGELPYPERFSVHHHLASCAQCGRMVERGRDAMNLSKAAAASAADPGPDEVPEQLVRAILVTCRGAH